MNTSKKLNQPVTKPQNLMWRYPLFLFFLMSYAFSWIIIIPYVLSVWGILKGDFEYLYMIKPFVGPALAAIVMTRIIDGKEGLLRLRKRLGQRNIGLPWYLMILVAIPALLLLGIIIQPGSSAGFQGFSPRLLVTYPLYFILTFFGVALPEEIGWRGFALQRMQLRYGPLWGSIFLGILWCFWHLFFFLTPVHGFVSGTIPGDILIRFSFFFLMLIALSVIFTWLFNRTGGSIFIATLLHASIDTPQLVLFPLFPAVNEAMMNLAGAIIFGILALLIIILTRGRLGYQGNLFKVAKRFI